MPRRAAPRSSAPVRTSSPSAPARSAPPAAPTRTASAPAPMPAATPIGARPGMGATGAAPSQGPGLMGQMAATAGGVAIGSAMGHYLTDKLMGGGDSKNEVAQPQVAQHQTGQPLTQPCEFEWRQFIECSQNQQDVSLCQGFNDIFRQCQQRLGQ